MLIPPINHPINRSEDVHLVHSTFKDCKDISSKRTRINVNLKDGQEIEKHLSLLIDYEYNNVYKAAHIRPIDCNYFHFVI